MSRLGSSPLARGLLIAQLESLFMYGIIPARAGFTGVRHNRSFWIPDHPRSRGVYTPAASATARLFGSSPLARGLLLVFALVRCVGGIIPARAGFTCSAIGWVIGVPDHPRSRGVYLSFEGGGGLNKGSSPLARGLRRPHGRVAVLRGIIPARAGFTASWAFFDWRVPDHPRSRGVYRTAYPR